MGRRASDISWRVAGIWLTFLLELMIVNQWPKNHTGCLRKANGALNRFNDSHFVEN